MTFHFSFLPALADKRVWLRKMGIAAIAVVSFLLVRFLIICFNLPPVFIGCIGLFVLIVTIATVDISFFKRVDAILIYTILICVAIFYAMTTSIPFGMFFVAVPDFAEMANPRKDPKKKSFLNEIFSSAAQLALVGLRFYAVKHAVIAF